MLLLFLRSPRATLVISLAIPVSIVASFVAMAALGRTLNVISLAGIAFAVGMVVDAAIVVLENIYRLRQQGMPPAQAAYEGARQVWGAILVSALTTVMVFIPILVMELEAGPALPRHRGGDLGLGGAVAGGRRDGDPGAFERLLGRHAARQAEGDAAARRRSFRAGLLLAGAGLHLADGAVPAARADLGRAITAVAIWGAATFCPSSNICPRATATWSSA